MPAVAKLNQIYGLLLKEESVYNTAVSLAGSADAAETYLGDGLPSAPSGLDYAFDGSVGRANATLAPARKTTPNGRSRKFSFKVLPKGAGTAYTSAAVLPPNQVHRALKAAGYVATFTTDRWVYAPSPAGLTYTSLTVEEYMQGERYAMAGVLLDLSMEAGDTGVPIWTFSGAGTASLPVDASFPTMVYQAPTVLPPVASGVTCTIGSFITADVKSMSYQRGRQFESNARLRQTVAGAHLGFVPGSVMPTITLEVDKTALVGTPFHTSGGFDAENLRASADVHTLSYIVGAANNGWRINWAQAQLTNVEPSADGPMATAKLTFSAIPSTPALDDYETITLF